MMDPIASTGSHVGRRISLAHVISSLGIGGAENVLLRLLAGLDETRFQSTVISITGPGPMADPIRALGVPVIALGSSPRISASARSMKAIGRTLRKLQPDIVQTWMYRADILGGCAARLVRRKHVVWGIHAGLPNPEVQPVAERVALRLGAMLSRHVPERIICCSQTSIDVHTELGYDTSKMVLIRNGFAFPLISSNREELRSELGIPLEALVVGRPGRFHPQKDYETLFSAIGTLISDRDDVYLIATGEGITHDNPTLRSLLSARHLTGHVFLLGPRFDTQAFYEACDVVVSTSYFGEAMPLILGEAMAAGVPVVTTDIGDSAYLVGDTGRIVPPRSPDELARALNELLSLTTAQRTEMGQLAQKRIATSFNLQAMVKQYSEIYENLATIQDSGNRSNAS